MIKDINPGTASGEINSGSAFARLNSTQVLFTANDGVHGVELWITDGTTNGTFMVKDIFMSYPFRSPIAIAHHHRLL